LEILSIGNDITQRLQAEKEIRELNASLEKRVAERTEELQSALVRAEAADKIKSAFLATMSHELRTPLNSIIGFTGIILQGMAGPLNPEQSKQLGMVRGSAKHLLELINDVLDISKIEAGQLEVRSEAFNLIALIERVVSLLSPIAEKKGLLLRTSITNDLGNIVSDRRRLEQILINLVNNAIKFTEKGGVTITAELLTSYKIKPDSVAAPFVKLSVADTGIGIKPEDLALLFQPFRQLDSGLSRMHEGTGLGLAICRRLLELMGGQITANSSWSNGSEFIVLLPLQGETKS
jgi:signal transduction histidine kinase